MPGTTYARFRLSTTGGLGPTGFAGDGEVEDYKISLGLRVFGEDTHNEFEVLNDDGDILKVYNRGILRASAPVSTVPSLLIQGLGAVDDLLTVNYGGPGGFFNVPITFDGGDDYGGGGFDALAIVGGTFATGLVSYINPTDGNVLLDLDGSGGVDPSSVTHIFFEDITPLTIDSTIADLTLALPIIEDELADPTAAVLGDDGEVFNNLSRLASSNGTFETTTFAEPTNSLTILRGNSGDDLKINNLPDFDRSITVGAANADFDRLTFGSSVDLAAESNLTAYATAIDDDDGFTLRGGSLVLTASDRIIDATCVVVAGGILNLGSFNDTVAAVTLYGGMIVGTSGVLTSTSDFDVQNGSVTARLGGDVALTKSTADSVTLAGHNSYTGDTNLMEGTLRVEHDGALGPTGELYVSDGVTLDLADGVEIGNDIEFGTLGGPTSATLTISQTGGLATLSGRISENDPANEILNIQKTGTGTLAIEGENVYQGSTEVASGTLLANSATGSATGSGPVTVRDEATLGGTGTASGTITVESGGAIAPGMSAGILNTGSVEFQNPSAFQVQIGGTTPGNAADNHDQLRVIGSVTIGDDVLLDVSALGGFSPSAGQQFLIIDNDDADEVVGSFADLAEGQSLSDFLGSGLNGVITYAGGDGNDVVITTANPDSTAPTADIGDVSPDPRNSHAGTVTINFSESVSGVDITDFSLTRDGNAVDLSNLSVNGSGTDYTLDLASVTGSEGSYLLTLLASGSAIQDAAGNALSGDASDSWVTDTTAPTTTIMSTASDPTNASPIAVTVTFSEPVSGFEAGDVSIGNGSVSNFAGSGASYSFDVTPAGQGAVTVDVAAGVAGDSAGNDNTAAAQLVRTFDSVAPTTTIASAASDPTNGSPIAVTVTFSEPVSGFDAGDVAIGNGTLSNFAGSGASYSFDVTPAGQGAVTVDVAAGVAGDSAGNDNTAAAQLVRTFDSVAPTTTIASAASDPTNASPIAVTVTFSEPVSGFDAGDVAIGNGSVSNFAGSGASYSFDVTPSDQGTVTVDVATGVAQDAAGNASSAAGRFSRTYNAPFNVSVNVFTTNPSEPSTLRIGYTITTHIAVGFELRLCASTDNLFDAGDSRCGPPIAISSFDDRTIGDHERTVDGADYAAILSDMGVAYFLAAAAPFVASLDTDAADDWASFVGVFHVADGPLVVRGRDGVGRTTADDTVTIAPTGDNTNVTVNGTTTMVATARIAEVRVLGLGGDDKVLGDQRFAKPIVAHGGDGDDQLQGGAGPDRLSGGAGNDSVVGGAGDDFLDGGAGTDRADFSGAAGGVTVDLGAGTAVGDGSDTLAAIEDVLGSDSADTLLGDALANMLFGGRGSDTIRGGAGKDVVDGGDDSDSVAGGPGDDSVVGGGGDDSLSGDDLDDAATDGNDTMFGGDGNDFLCGHGGDDELNGDVGNDTLVGHGGDDVLRGGADDDLLGGEAGQDQLFGDDGNDILSGGDDPDTLQGGAGADVVAVIPGQDTVVQEPVAPKKRGRGKGKGKGKGKGGGGDRIIFGR